jgi:hypothetical protein
MIVDTNGLSAWWLNESSFIRNIEQADRLVDALRVRHAQREHGLVIGGKVTRRSSVLKPGHVRQRGLPRGRDLVGQFWSDRRRQRCLELRLGCRLEKR